jgi:FkbM family methyltransferase
MLISIIARIWKLFVRLLCFLIPTKELRFRFRKAMFSRKYYWKLYGFCVKRVLGLSQVSGLLEATDPNWMSYMLQNNMPEKLRALRRNLDSKSLELVDSLSLRTIILPKEIKWNCFCKKEFFDKIFTETELREYEEFNRNLKKYKSNFPLSRRGDNIYSPETFLYNSGLVNKNEKIKNYIAGKDFIDGGAFYGDTALVYAKLYNPKKVYSFEISPTNMGLYNKTMKINNIANDKCEVLFLGLADTKKKISFHDNGGVGTTIFSDGEVVANLCDLDSFVEENKLTVGFIKTDLEGSDFDALRGMVKTIKKDRPVLSLSIYHGPKDFFEMKPFLEDVVSAGGGG